MKTNLLKSFLAIVMLGSMAPNAAAEEQAPDYKPLLTDGKSWLIAHCQSDGDWGLDTQFMVEVKGNQRIGDVQCKRLVKYYIGREAEIQEIFAYEADRKVYRVIPQDAYYQAEPKLDLLMDFSMTTGDSKPLTGDGNFTRTVTEDKTITAQSVDYRMLTLQTIGEGFDSAETGYWVEGVGACNERDFEWFAPVLYPIEPTGEQIRRKTIMVSCYQDGEKIFDHSDFCGETYTYREPAKILAEGRSWLMAGVSRMAGIDDRFFRFSVKADTIVGEQPCKAIEYYNIDKPEEKKLLHACEINGRLFIVSDENHSLMGYENEPGTLLPVLDIAAPATGMPLLLYDFRTGLPDGLGGKENLEYFPYMYPDYPAQGDYEYEFSLKPFDKENVDLPTRAVTTVKLNERFYVDWVEGIGSSVYDYRFLTGWPYAATIGCIDEYHMIECRQDDKVIFTADDFFSTYDGIEEVRTEAAAADGAIYDLQGRRLAKPLPGQLYIRDGHLRRN